ncbi:Eukaryotic translation initiation factor 3 subunit H, partial [Galemys pyrenaicus]
GGHAQVGAPVLDTGINGRRHEDARTASTDRQNRQDEQQQQQQREIAKRSSREEPSRTLPPVPPPSCRYTDCIIPQAHLDSQSCYQQATEEPCAHLETHTNDPKLFLTEDRLLNSWVFVKRRIFFCGIEKDKSADCNSNFTFDQHPNCGSVRRCDNIAQSLGEILLPEEDLTKLFDPPQPPDTMVSLSIAGQINTYCQDIMDFAAPKLREALHALGSSRIQL